MPKLQVCNLSKNFTKNKDKLNGTASPNHQQLLVLDRINLDIYPREFICIVGASGCGKSTLLNIVAGLLPSSSGKVAIDGTELLGPGAARGGWYFKTILCFLGLLSLIILDLVCH